MWPCLVKKWMLNKLVSVSLGNGDITDDGETIYSFNATLKANVQFKAEQKLTADKELVTIKGKACFPGDIFPALPAIVCGTVIIDGATYKVYSGRKSYNPDGSVNFTELEVV